MVVALTQPNNQTAAWLRSMGRAPVGEVNQTSEWLRSIGRGDLADMIQSGKISASDAMSQASGGRQASGPQSAMGGGPERLFLAQAQAQPAAPDGGLPQMRTQGQRQPDVMQQFQDMTFEDRERFLRGLNQGLSAEEAMQPEGFEPYDYFDRMSGYDMSGPERLYTAQQAIQPQMPDYSFDDSVTDRRLAGQELDYRSAMARLEAIDAQLAENPDLLDGMTFSGDLRRRGLAFWERLGFDLSEDSEQYLSDQTAFRQSILRNINRTIQEVTGAQMGEQEARRIRAEMPDVTASPTEFRTQLSNAMNMIRMDAARVALWRQGGGEGRASDISERDVMQALRERGASAYEQALQRGMSTSEARLEAARILREEFGL